MPVSKLGLVAVFCSGIAAAQGVASARATLAPQTTLPVTFTKTVDANHAKAGDPVTARTLMTVRLADGREVKAGAQVLGHVSEAQPFVFNRTPYARQGQAVLTIQFDTLSTAQGETVPLHVYLRAMADTFATDAAFEPRPSDEDLLHSTTQVGGDRLTPSQNEITNRDGDVVGYNKRGGTYAHLVANTDTGSVRCDESNTEQAVALFSASACGLYGFTDASLTSTGFGADSSSFTLTSWRRSPAILRHSAALLEVVSVTNTASVSN